jgi:Cu2+-exporting ATPase
MPSATFCPLSCTTFSYPLETTLVYKLVSSELKRRTIDELNKMGIEVAMLTGDSQAVAKAVASQLDIQRVFAEVLPEHKDQKVMELQKLGKRVAMVGEA